MKSVVIITIIFLSSFVVFDSFAQNSEESLGGSVVNITSYIAAAIVMVIIPILIILLVLKRKGKLTSPTFKKILAGIGLLFLGLFILSVAGSMSITDEEKAELERQDREKAQQEMLERVAQQEKEAELKQQEEELKQQEELIQKANELPASCEGVLSAEVWLYPTGQACLEEILLWYYDWCAGENEDTADACVKEMIRGLELSCEDSLISSQEVCMMYSMKELYKKRFI